jgi:hypothetical protein
MDLREFREQGGLHTSKHALMDLKLYLETPNNPDKPLPLVSGGRGGGCWGCC